MSSEVAIRVENLSKRYRIGGRQERYKTLRESVMDVLGAPLRRLRRRPEREDEILWALRDVSFEIAKGEVVGVIGRNGAGKSTLLKVLSRITEPTSGRAEIHGRVGSLLEVGTGFHPELTGRENIYLNGAILGMRRGEIDCKLDEIVAFAEIDRFLDTAVKHYSSGMYLRLAFAVAAHLDTEILLVDEVLAVGDAAFQKRCLSRLQDVASDGRTVAFVSHNLGAVRALCQRAIWIDDGTISLDGASDTVAQGYLAGLDSERTSVSWSEVDGPACPVAQLRGVAIAAVPAVAGPPTNEIPLEVKVDWTVQEPGHRLNLSILVFSQEGVCVFASASTLDPRWQGRVSDQGHYKSTCAIPEWLLNAGFYRMSLLVVEDATRVLLRCDDVLDFQVAEGGSDRAGWLGPWPGVVRPKLAWATEVMAEAGVGQ